MSCRLLEGKTAVVTGAAQGLGEALARRLYEEGCRVVVADMNYEKAAQVAESLPGGTPFNVYVTTEYLEEYVFNETV